MSEKPRHDEHDHDDDRLDGEWSYEQPDGERPDDEQPDGDGRDKRRDERREKWKAVLDRYRKEWRGLADDKDRNWSAWLVLRYTGADVGFRPIPSGQVFWSSPDIWVESSDPAGRPVVGEDNFVHARIFNLGKASAAPTRVDFYWADPSLGLGPANMNLIGTEWVEVLPHTAREVRCNTPWVPVFVNGGHECLMVNCNNAILDPITHPFQPQLDRHVGQRNVSVLQRTERAYAMTLTVNNFFPFAARMRVGAVVHNLHLDPERIRGLAARDILAAAVAFGQPDAVLPERLMHQYRQASVEHRRAMAGADFLARVRPGGLAVHALSYDDARMKNAPAVEADWTGEVAYVRPDAPNKYAGQLLAGFDAFDDAGKTDASAGAMVLARDTFEPFEQRRLAVRLGAPADPGRPTISVAHVQQWLAGYPVGGYTLLGLTDAALELLGTAQQAAR